RDVMDAIGLVEAAQLKKDRVGFNPGDTVRVYVKVVEGEKERTQLFEGVVIRKRGEGGRASFTVRRISYGVGVERTFPLHSPRIDKIDVVRHGKVRRSKLYYLRSLAGKAARLKEKRTVIAVPARGVADSKLLSPERREELFVAIHERAFAVGVAIIDHATIDRVNILQATRLAMLHALGGLSVAPDFVITDFVSLPGVPCPQKNLV